jgi:isopentenyldiphosphate isomerase
MIKVKVVESKTLTETEKAKAIKTEIVKANKYKAKMPHDWHEIHLCYLANIGYQQQNTDEYKSLVRHPNYMCKHCGRVAEDKKNLCTPVSL